MSDADSAANPQFRSRASRRLRIVADDGNLDWNASSVEKLLDPGDISGVLRLHEVTRKLRIIRNSAS